MARTALPVLNTTWTVSAVYGRSWAVEPSAPEVDDRPAPVIHGHGGAELATRGESASKAVLTPSQPSATTPSICP